VAPPTSPIREYISVVQARKGWIIGVTAVVLGSALVYSLSKTPVYQSTATVLVRPISLSPADSNSSDFVRIPVEQALAGSGIVATSAAEDLGASATTTRISVRGDQDSNTLRFTATSPSPTTALAAAQAFADAYLNVRRNEVLQDLQAASVPISQRIALLSTQIDQVQADLSKAVGETRRTTLQIRLNSLLSERASLEQKQNDLILPENLHVGDVIQPALLPSGPSSPNHMRAALYALFVGLGLGVGFAFARDRMDDTIRGWAVFEEVAGAPVFAVIRRPNPRAPVEVMGRGVDERAELFSGLRTSVAMAAAREGAQAILITDVAGEASSSMVAANLALSLAASGKRVLLVEANLRQPQLEIVLGLSPRITSSSTKARLIFRGGLTNVLAEEITLENAMVQVGPDSLLFLGPGPLIGHPADVLGSDSMRALLVQLRSEADLVLLVAPPMLAASDAVSLAAVVDGTILVGALGRTTRGGITEARRLLDQVGARVMGGALIERSKGLRRALLSARSRTIGAPPKARPPVAAVGASSVGTSADRDRVETMPSEMGNGHEPLAPKQPSPAPPSKQP
jgi:Mrp family chromosome partitioning ATPase/capsular polysaccharide biosynthesis protein